MVDIYSIRDLNQIQDPALATIRDSIIFAYDETEEIYGNSIEADTVFFIKTLRKGDKYKFPLNVIGIYKFLVKEGLWPISDDNYSEVESIVYYHLLTTGKCREMSSSIADYLLDKEEQEYNVYVIRNNTGSRTKDFLGHYAALAKNKANGKWYLFSPANIFNPDMSYPKSEKGNLVDRATSVISANSYQEAINALIEQEGGMWPSEDALEEHVPAF